MGNTHRNKNDYQESKLYHIKKSTDIRDAIQYNHHKISELLANQAKHFSDLDWVPYQIHKESEILMRIPYDTKSRSKKFWLDYPSIKNQEKTYEYICSRNAQRKTITRLEVIDIHRRLAYKTKIAPGRYRISNGVYLIGTGIAAPDYNRIDSTMDDIVFRLNNNNSGKDFLTRALDFHYEMFATQPFDDYNKRTARMVMNWFLLQNDCEPILFNRRTDYRNYAHALMARAQNDCHTYNRYMLECLVRTQEDIIDILKNHAMSDYQK